VVGHSNRPFRRLRVLLVGLVAPALLAAAPAPPRPNIVLLMSDDQGWGELGVRAHSQLQTPALDAMSRAGVRFDRFYAAAPLCSPTRASVLTGRHPNRSGVLSRNYALRPEEITLAEILKRAGYRTAHFGKWHLGPVKADSPLNPRAFGFDEYLSGDRAFNLNDVLSRDGAPPLQFEGEGSEIVVHEALGFMRKARAEGVPFFVVIWFGSPHAPYVGTAADLARYLGGDEELRNRFAEITALDRAVGRVRVALRRMHASRDTLVWFCSDNGPPANIRENGRLSGGKGSLAEGGIRVPGMLEWPGVIAKGRVISTPATTSDILPTLVELLGMAPPARPLDGVSLVPLIEGRELVRPPIGFWIYPAEGERRNMPWLPERALVGEPHVRSPRMPARFRAYRHPVAKSDGFAGAAAWLDGDWKLRVEDGSDGGPPRFELFELGSDPGERRNLAQGHPERVAEMSRALRAWQRSVERSLTGADFPKVPAD
jgi:arylsulfatase A-like enzyme